MRDTPIAVGFRRIDISSAQQQWDEIRMRSLASRLGYEIAELVDADADTPQPIEQLTQMIRKLSADAVIAPGPEHFVTAEHLAEVVQLVDVVTVDPETTFARWASGELPVITDGAQ